MSGLLGIFGPIEETWLISPDSGTGCVAVSIFTECDGTLVLTVVDLTGEESGAVILAGTFLTGAGLAGLWPILAAAGTGLISFVTAVFEVLVSAFAAVELNLGFPGLGLGFVLPWAVSSEIKTFWVLMWHLWFLSERFSSSSSRSSGCRVSSISSWPPSPTSLILNGFVDVVRLNFHCKNIYKIEQISHGKSGFVGISLL